MTALYEKYNKMFSTLNQQKQSAESYDSVWATLDNLNDQYWSLIDMLDDFTQKRRKHLQSRIEMQEAIRDATIETGVLSVFCKDQLAFYQTELHYFRKEVLSSTSRCVTLLSTRQMLLILRLARELNIIADSSLKHYVTFIGAYVSTAHQENISTESLRKKYSQINPKILKEVKEILQQMIAKLNEYGKDII